MGRTPKPWYRKARGEWCVNLDGKLHRLGKDRVKAFARFAALIGNAPAPTLPDSTCTFTDLVSAFLDWIEANRRYQTYRLYRTYLDQFHASLDPGTLASEITPHVVEAWVASHPKWSPNTRHAAIRCVKACYRWAVDDREILERNPVRQLKAPKQQSREHTLSKSQKLEVLNLNPNQNWRDTVTFLLQTGCRPQEFRAIEAKDYRNGAITISPAGGNKRRRQIFLTPEAEKIVKRLAKKHPEGPIFRNRMGEPVSSLSVRCRFRSAAKRLKIPWLCAYTLRHTWATDALANGVDVATVAQLMGNSIRTVMLHYGHLAVKGDYLREQARKAVGDAG